MKMIVRIFAGLMGLLLIVLVGVAFFPAAAYEPPARDLMDESAYRLNEKVGWYRLEDSSHWLLTWGAENGLVLYRFGGERDSLERIRFSPTSVHTLVAANASRANRLEFVESQDGGAPEARLTDEGVVTQTMIRVAGIGYETREVRFSNGPTELVGLLFEPDGPGPYPAVAFIHGSGVSHRDNFWYLSPADYLAKRGIMVLLPDKRGSGKSGGEWHTSAFADFAGDALAAVALLGEQPSVDRTKIGLVGFSQGGWIAPLAASRSEDVAFVVTVSGSAAMPSEALVYEVHQEIVNSGVPAVVARIAAPLFARRAKMPRKQWWDLNAGFDPVRYWRELEIPSLMIFGEEDQNVDVARSLMRLKAAGVLEQRSFRTKVFPGLSHGLIRQDTGWLEGEYLGLLARFIQEQAKG